MTPGKRRLAGTTLLLALAVIFGIEAARAFADPARTVAAVVFVVLICMCAGVIARLWILKPPPAPPR